MLSPANVAATHSSNLSVRPRLASHPFHHVIAIGRVIYGPAPLAFRLKPTSSVIDRYHIASRSEIFAIRRTPGLVIGSSDQKSRKPLVDWTSIPAGPI